MDDSAIRMLEITRSGDPSRIPCRCVGAYVSWTLPPSCASLNHEATMSTVAADLRAILPAKPLSLPRRRGAQRRTKFLPAFVIALGVNLLGGCRGNSHVAEGSVSDSLYIGVEQAVQGARGVALALDHLNARRPDGTRPFAIRNPLGQGTTSVAIATAFRDDPRLIGVIGHQGSNQLLEAAPVYSDIAGRERRAVPVITPTGTNAQLTLVGRWIMRICPQDADNARALAQFAIDSLHARRVAVIYRNDVFGRGFLRGFESAFAALGGRIIERDPHLAGVTEYDAYFQRMMLRKPDALVIAGGSAEYEPMLVALHTAGADMLPILASDDMASWVGDSVMLRDRRIARYTSFYVTGSPISPEGERFEKDYRAKWGIAANHQAALAYDAATLMGEAVWAVGADRLRVRDWLASVGRTSPPFAGISGEIRFDENDNAVNKRIVIARIGQ